VTAAASMSDYLGTFNALLGELDLAAVERVVERFGAVRDAGGTVFVAGNGGSAATASHWVNDLGKATKVSGRAMMRVVCLSDNTPWLTALANDEGYDRAFAGQLENFAAPGDLLVVISASGNSPNLLRAVELASSRSVASVALLGFDGGALKSMVDEAIWVRSEQGAYGPVETMHVLVADLITTCLIHDRV
jgi:D-sedoheptulose 7-phosphate isomerase